MWIFLFSPEFVEVEGSVNVDGSNSSTWLLLVLDIEGQESKF